MCVAETAVLHKSSQVSTTDSCGLSTKM